MLIAWAVSCDSYELRDDGTADIFGAGFDTHYVDELPTKVEVTILVRLLMQEDEANEIELHVLGPDTGSLGSLSHPVEAEPGPNHRPGYIVAQIEALEVGFLAESEGVYSIEIYADAGKGQAVSAERRQSIFLNVRAGSPE